MFFYLSFLRPPPSQASLSAPITLTPQVANDLRTELFPAEQEIFFVWSSASPSNQNTLPAITEPKKLTIWRPNNAYKEVYVPLPPGIREGQSWRLHLIAHPRGNPHVVNLAESMLGARPFPVASMPVLFSSKTVRNVSAKKQEQVERVYRIPLTDKAQVFLHVKEQTSFDLDKKIWDSGIGLSSWIVGLAAQVQGAAHPPLVAKMREVLFSSQPRSALELGAGTGIVSLTLGALRSAVGPSEEGCIIATDLPSAMPLLKDNIIANDALFAQPSVRPQATVLDWDEQLPDQVTSVNGGFDVILMADVAYNTASFPALVKTLASLLRLCPPTVLILLGYKERDAAERTLWNMAQEVGIAFEQVGTTAGAGGEPVEVWIAQVV